ncbi:MerR family transcriptional regulator [Cohnella cholangitidis]|uniref:Methyltransferase domain-containing protein n=1 Tax=Cohnella cholangitidis TaxID=2598458 RepID=A0A7G5C3T1_9BACL|nr:methyltransferase domain-containing protein [Cohnella cholangitidis]QMV43865.1 methyltransferase domain-containing protein [Cohnella cholangitidis]
MKPTVELHTTGQIAKQTGITVRTLRYYDQIGLLTPSQINQASARLYNKSDLIRLQKIQTLKSIGLSLVDVKRILHEDESSDQDLLNSLRMQKEFILSKYAHLNFVVRAIDEAMSVCEGTNGDGDWKSLFALFDVVNTERRWLEQYLTANRLQARIDLYDRFSANRMGWHRWFFEHLGTQPNLRVLEVGCGDGTLWERNRDRIPESWQITLTDISQGMVNEARGKTEHSGGNFKFLAADIQDIPFHDNEFDVVIANHMLYHVIDQSKAMAELVRVLKPGGALFASTMSRDHLSELETLVGAFDPQLEVLDPVMERFHLDNGTRILEGWFSEIKEVRYEDHLLVNDIIPLLSYITSTPMNAREILTGKKLNEFRAFLNERITSEKPFYITKDSGFFRGTNRKRQDRNP